MGEREKTAKRVGLVSLSLIFEANTCKLYFSAASTLPIAATDGLQSAAIFFAVIVYTVVALLFSAEKKWSEQIW